MSIWKRITVQQVVGHFQTQAEYLYIETSQNLWQQDHGCESEAVSLGAICQGYV